MVGVSGEISLFDKDKLSDNLEELKIKYQEITEELNTLDAGYNEILDAEGELEGDKKQRAEVVYKLKTLEDSLLRQEVLEKRLDEINSEGEGLKDNLERLEKIFLNKSEKVKEEIIDLKKSLGGLDLDSLLSGWKEIQGRVSSLESDYAYLKKEEEELSLVKGDYQEQMVELNKLTFWDRGFGEVKKRLVNAFLPVLGQRTNYYLDFLETGMQVGFDIDFTRKNNEFIVYVFEGGQEWKFEQRSKGERTRVSVAIGFALKEFSPYNVLRGLTLYDEIADSLDETGLLEFFRLLTDGAEGQNFVISHRSSVKDLVDVPVIQVIREDGVARIEWEG